ncbi:MAG: endolytic transglycosylase MltG [Acholeplasmataceae bacterium]|nr:endolytic transglycosylase MltG [Acholeplasmataceae bacterium]
MHKKHLAILILSLFILVTVFAYGAWNNYGGNADMAATGKVVVVIRAGMSTGEIADMLHKNNLISSPAFFRIQSRLANLDSSMQAGEYELEGGMTNGRIIEVFAKGMVRQLKITIPEGFTIEQIARKIETEGFGKADTFKLLAKDFAPYEYMKSENTEITYMAEGFAYPSTYYVTKGATEKEILTMMVKEFDAALRAEYRKMAQERNLNIRDLVNLASLVEKEAIFADERPLIAGVFWKRLQIGMPLQSDTTIQYILGTQKSEISIADTKINSPYNTYQHTGLPPGPIANPGLGSIEAVLRPKETKFLYFVANLEGRHNFTETYQEHLREIEKIHGQQ